MTQLLLNRGVSASVQKDDLWSPLHLASASSHQKVVKLLGRHGASVDILNDSQEMPLGLAACNENLRFTRHKGTAALAVKINKPQLIMEEVRRFDNNTARRRFQSKHHRALK
ncbi:hypothetical protein BC827DRAFT_524348 [Russula dissimulans]|nr:hypothetical protein BC827DRAFT_524348 [Russula dissimulans]